MVKAIVRLMTFLFITAGSACDDAPPRLSPWSMDAGRDARTDGDAMSPIDAGMGEGGQMVPIDGAIADATMPMDSGAMDAGFDAGLPFGPGQCNPGYPSSYAPGCDCFCYGSLLETADCQDGTSPRCQTVTMPTDAGVMKNFCYADQDAGMLQNRCGWSLASPYAINSFSCETELLTQMWGVFVSAVATGETCVIQDELLNGTRYYSFRCTGNPTPTNHELGWLPNAECGNSNLCTMNGANIDLYSPDGGSTNRNAMKFTVTFNINCTQATFRAVNPITQSQLWFVVIKPVVATGG